MATSEREQRAAPSPGPGPLRQRDGPGVAREAFAGGPGRARVPVGVAAAGNQAVQRAIRTGPAGGGPPAPGAGPPHVAPPDVHRALRSPGWALDTATARVLRPHFGAQLDSVRVHADAAASASARAVRADAYAVGRDLVFAAGRYEPWAASGLRLLAHELAHARQQGFASYAEPGGGGGGGMAAIRMSSSTAPDEARADAVADAVMRGQAAPASASAHCGGLCLARQPEGGGGGGATTVPGTPYGPAQAAGDVAAGAGAIAEVEGILRTLYQRADEAILAEAEFMIRKAVAEGADEAKVTEAVAKWAVDARNAAKVKIRQWDLDVLRLLAERSNAKIYGDPVGPSYGQLRHGDPARNIKPRTDVEVIQGANKTRPGVNRWVGRLRIAGRIAIAIDIVLGVSAVISAPEADRPRVLIREVSGLAGALAGGWAGAKVGGWAGAGIGAWFGGAGAVPGAAIGVVVGGIGGAIGGGLLGRAAGDFVADQFYPPEQTGFEGGPQ